MCVCKALHGFLCDAADLQRLLDPGVCLGQLGGVLFHSGLACCEGEPLERKLGGSEGGFARVSLRLGGLEGASCKMLATLHLADLELKDIQRPGSPSKSQKAPENMSSISGESYSALVLAASCPSCGCE